MRPEAAMKLLKKQPTQVREAVAVLLDTVEPEAIRYFGTVILGWLADEIRGKPFRGVPAEAVEEFKIPG